LKIAIKNTLIIQKQTIDRYETERGAIETIVKSLASSQEQFTKLIVDKLDAMDKGLESRILATAKEKIKPGLDKQIELNTKKIMATEMTRLETNVKDLAAVVQNLDKVIQETSCSDANDALVNLKEIAVDFEAWRIDMINKMENDEVDRIQEELRQVTGLIYTTKDGNDKVKKKKV